MHKWWKISKVKYTTHPSEINIIIIRIYMVYIYYVEHVELMLIVYNFVNIHYIMCKKWDVCTHAHIHITNAYGKIEKRIIVNPFLLFYRYSFCQSQVTGSFWEWLYKFSKCSCSCCCLTLSFLLPHVPLE